MDAVPEHLLPQILAKIEHENAKLSRSTLPVAIAKFKKNGEPRKVPNKKFNEMYGLDLIKPHCTLGVKPTANPNKEHSRSRNQEQVIDFSSHCLELLFTLCSEEKSVWDEETLFTFKKSDPLQTVRPEDQYDFFNSEIKIDDTGNIKAYGEIPRANGKHDYLPMRRPHLWMELFRRGFDFERPGPLGINEPWIVYNLEYLGYILFVGFLVRPPYIFLLEACKFLFLSQLGKQEVLNFFNETGLCVCRDILEVLVSEIMMIELKNCPDFRVKDHLGKISHCFYNGMLVFLDNGIGVKRPDGRASKLNVRALVQYAISNFGWSSSIQSDGQTKKNGSKAAPGAAPAVTIFQLFRWSEAAFRIKHGIESESKIIISTFVNSAIQKALGRKHALTINERVTKKQFVCKSLQHFNIESVEEKLHKKQKKSEIIMEEEEIRKKREKSETAEEKKEDFLKDNDEWNEFFAQKEETVPGFDLIEETIAFFGKENNMHDEMSNKLDSV